MLLQLLWCWRTMNRAVSEFLHQFIICFTLPLYCSEWTRYEWMIALFICLLKGEFQNLHQRFTINAIVACMRGRASLVCINLIKSDPLNAVSNFLLFFCYLSCCIHHNKASNINLMKILSDVLWAVIRNSKCHHRSDDVLYFIIGAA